MAVRRINERLKRLDMHQVEQTLMRDDSPGGGVYVCDVSVDGWERYVKSESQLLMSRCMEWRDGELHIVELSTTTHGDIAREIYEAFAQATGTGTKHLVSHRDAYVEGLRLYEPDECFGPHRRVLGVVVPAGLTPEEYHTLKVEVGMSRTWPDLDRKPTQWSTFPGVQYILCIRVSPSLQVRQYKLHQVAGGAIVAPPMQPADITGPTTLVSFDSHRLLGFPTGSPLPLGFSSPNMTIDLSAALAEALYGRI